MEILMAPKDLYVRLMLPMQNQVLNMGMTNSKCIREVQKTLRGTVRFIIQKCFVFIHWLTIADIKHHDYDNLFNKEFT